MTPQMEPLFSRSFDLICDLGVFGLSASDAMLRCQMDHSRNFLALGGDRLRAGLGGRPEQWVAPIALQDAVDSARRCVVVASTWQAETMRLIETQSAKANAILADALADSLAAVQGEAPHAGRGRSRKSEHKLAA